MSDRKKLLYVTPHLSTGGMPQYLLKQIESFIKDYEIQVVEIHNHSDVFVVQKNKIKELCILHTLGDNKEELLDIIKEESPNIIHFTEVPEHYIGEHILEKIFDNSNREFDIVVSTHGSLTEPNKIKYHPDRYILVSEWSRRKFEHLGIDTTIWEYPIENYQYDKDSAKEELGFEKDWKHVLMVGLFTRGKNQAEIFKVARHLEKYKIKFHFVGNQAQNFQGYWMPLMRTKPSNCIVWGERTDVDKFYKASDMFYFSSTMELNPLSVKEALSYKLPSIFRKLPTYLDTYDSNELVTYINGDIGKTKRTILEILKPELNEIPGSFTYSEVYDDVISKAKNNSKFVEIGSWFGKSTNYLVNKIKESNKNIDVYSVDSFKGSGDDITEQSVVEAFNGDIYYEFMENSILSDTSENITIIKDDSILASNHFQNNTLDFLMIDSNKTYESVYDNLKNWYHKIKPNGVISGYGYTLNDNVKRAVNHFFYNQVNQTSRCFIRNKPRIQIKHLMTKPNDMREKISSYSLRQLERFGIDYTPIVNEVYKGLPPSDFCRRPHHIAEKPGDFGNGLGPITGPHYGCFMAHRNAIETMNDDYDYTLIFEADAYIYTGLEEFADVIHKACFISERDNVYQISFANNNSHKKDKVDEYFSRTANNQDLAHCYLVPNRTKDWWVERFNDSPWDGWDIWMNIIFANHPQLRYTTNKLHCKQSEGFSLIDQKVKTWRV